MTTKPADLHASGAAPAAAIQCPACKSSGVRRSRWRREDGLLRKFLYSRYRCRDCRTRFSRFDGSAVAVFAAVVAILGAAIAGGWALGKLGSSDAETAVAEPAAPPLSSPLVSAPVPYPGLSELAGRGDARAQHSLAMAYLNGQGVVKDVALALKWIEKSAQQGYADGQYALGSMYLAGRGTLQNFQTAFEWFEKAAQQDHVEAQYRLGTMYRSGHGVGADKAKAYVWFSLAAAQGHPQAAEDRDSLLSSLTNEQVALAQREARAWRPSTAKP